MSDPHTGAVPYTLYTDIQMENLGPPEWLIEDILPAHCLAVIYGDPGVGKSFLALDWGLSIAHGQLWHGHACKRGPVVYVAAEGGSGMGLRLRSWKTRYNLPGQSNVHFAREPVFLLEADATERLILTLRKMSVPPVVLIVDTMARCFSGGDENTTKDLSRFVAALDRIRQEFGCAILLVHHTGKDPSKKERGGTALRGAADTMIAMQKHKDVLDITCEKQRDSQPFDPIGLKFEPIDLGGGTSSCVLDFCVFQARTGGLTQNERNALLALHSFGPAGATSGEWQTKFEDMTKKTGPTFQRTRKELEKNGYVESPSTGPKKGARYVLTKKGEITINVP